MSIDLTLAYSVDRSWSRRVPANLDGDMYPSAATKYHRPSTTRDESFAACSRRIILNNLPGDGRGYDPAVVPRSELCRRCFPKG